MHVYKFTLKTQSYFPKKLDALNSRKFTFPTYLAITGLNSTEVFL